MAHEQVTARNELIAACEKIDRDVPPVLERLKAAAARSVNSSLDLARAARDVRVPTRPHAVPTLPGIGPMPEGDLTGRFRAFK